MRFCLFILAVLLQTNALGAYRAYKLKVQYYDPQRKKEVTKTVMSNLDHLQYEHYNSGYGEMKVTLIDTWYCPGDTSRKDYCKKPKERKPAPRDIASAYDKEKRTPILPMNRQPVIP